MFIRRITRCVSVVTSLQNFFSISLKASESALSRSEVNVPGNVAVPGIRNVTMGTSASLLLSLFSVGKYSVILIF